MSVTREDGGRLNAFAKEPPILLVESGGSIGRASLVLLIGGAALVLGMVAVAVRIS
ncbi:ssl1498 family light-harvesting-like protein [Synechococcus sp. CS-1325]|uniref:photosystem II assembly protein Psb34 n=1 Tax=unclassified Synechococcus TaxID=2626047 RepID=UPI000DB1813B|nr:MULTISPECIES: ssl1498 family light-harvesting-like protein [unclassified Synechococcus]PZV01913.1 MAG: ssl1498 family light-harvesting-like protein [Cyanobium sp.]MCT0199133.1 ssl1498 family light-harvesting-like protein [Synechococcus sp. CS-1325]MCT0214688.1 ssl1498 family light-harvesting-like protein [Synechococcus sp. CS-1326]MCT0231122.1 ssl1498 family light-harvesting-like protein [Synechococcus sp. CS-1324]MCT0234022.1 ssl1498 family light-harvesting-like protein [Synechococcus sp. 